MLFWKNRLKKHLVKNGHKLIMGGPGTGKTFHFFLNNLLLMNEGYIIVDRDGELYKKTKNIFLENGYTVIQVDESDFSLGTKRYIHQQKTVLFIKYVFLKQKSFSPLLEQIMEEIFTLNNNRKSKELLNFQILIDDGGRERINNLHRFLEQGRKSGITINISFQGLFQLKELYKDNYDILLNHFKSIFYYGSNDEETLEYVVNSGALNIKEALQLTMMPNNKLFIISEGKNIYVNKQFNL